MALTPVSNSNETTLTLRDIRKTKPRKLNKVIKDAGFSQVPRGQGAARGGSHGQFEKDGKKMTFAPHGERLLKPKTARSLLRAVAPQLPVATPAVPAEPQVITPVLKRGPSILLEEPELDAPIPAPISPEDSPIERAETAPAVIVTPPPSQPPREEPVPIVSEERPHTAPAAMVTVAPRDDQQGSVEKPEVRPFRTGAAAKKRRALKNKAKKAAAQADTVKPEDVKSPSIDKKSAAPVRDWEKLDIIGLGQRIIDTRENIDNAKKLLLELGTTPSSERTQVMRIKIRSEFDYKKMSERFSQLLVQACRNGNQETAEVMSAFVLGI